MALELSWAVVLIGFAYGLVTAGPEAMRMRLIRAAILGALVAGGLLLVGGVIGFVTVGPLDPLPFVANFAVLALLFVVGLLFGEELSRRRPTGT